MSLAGGRLVVVRGAGDLGTGVIVRLSRAGFRVVALETERPRAIRRAVSLSEAVYDGEAAVEGVRGVRCERPPTAWGPDEVPVLVDPEARAVPAMAPAGLVDAIVAKRSLGTHPGMARVVVALGPGFEAPRDAHAVVETNRGHDLGRVILRGSAMPDTGVPALVGDAGPERVVRAPTQGPVALVRAIGDRVAAGEALLTVGDTLVRTAVPGVVRGLIRPGFLAWPGLKVADVDPRAVREHCFRISDKALSVAGGVIEALLRLL